MLLLAALVLVVAPPGGPPPAAAATRVAKDDCRGVDPNLVNGVCLRYPTARGTALTWIGTYRAPDGRIFFCIDYLYDSRLPAKADRISTERLVNQLGERVGPDEVAALNYVISTWAGRGSTGSDERDAAIALIVREVMSDGTRPGGLVVYPEGLEVGERVRPPVGGLGGQVLDLARTIWREASRSYGPWTVSLKRTSGGPMRLGRTRAYRVKVMSAAGHQVHGARVRLRCRGPIECPRSITTAPGARLKVRPDDTGRYRIRARVSGPDSDGLLYRQRSWRTHGGATARAVGVQRGWIAQDNRAKAVATERTTIKKALPQVTTVTSDPVVEPGAEIHDVVTVSGLPEGYDRTVVATLHGPFDLWPGATDCTDETRVGRVTFDVDRNGTFTTPAVVVDEVGYYTWVQHFRGDRYTEPLTTRCGIVEETTVVEPLRPDVSTEASLRRGEVGDVVHDRIEITGLEDTVTDLVWKLHGPRREVDGSCREVRWVGAPIADRGTLPVAGDGTYRTPDTTLAAAGCHTYSVTVRPTAVSTEAVSPPGLVLETVRVRRRTPVVTTVVSDQRAVVGDRLRDTVRLRGLRSDDRVEVRWWLHGPIAPRGASCRRLDWSDAPVADRGELAAQGNGRYRTRWSRVTTAGCYTYSEQVPGTPATEPTRTPPGLVSETSLVTRPVLPVVPEIPSGFAISTADLDRPARHAVPRHLDERYVAPKSPALRGRTTTGASLSIPRVGIRAGISNVGLDGDTMAVPNDTDRVGWLSSTAAPDDRTGSSVISGHVSDRRDRPGALWRLRDVRVGDDVRWTDASGETHRFVVRRVQRFARAQGVPARLLRTTGRHVLHLVTCTNRQRNSSGFHYADNLVVTAEEVHQ
ncbi:class F sortase [Nocardioides sp.]|uniref:class F sortase n=1 Tax=Nocardioides sp. TaxID=35761 RepID=UPI002B2756E7|nr:class F sortase [Nocardioides sp.]